MAARFPMAVVVAGSPLTVTIEGASAVVAAEDFVGGLATDDRVQAAFLGDRLTVLAKAGGITIPAATRSSTDYLWANAAARTAQTGMIAGERGYQTDTGITYRRDTSAWIVDPLYCSLRKTSNQNLTTTAAALIWDVEASDRGGMHDNAVNNTRITTPTPGLYEVLVQIYNNNSGGVGTVLARINGSSNVTGSQFRAAGASGVGIPLTSVFPVVMEADDYLEIMVLHSTTSGLIDGGTGASSAVVTVKRLGPA